MQNDLQDNRPATLVSELNVWNRRENQFMELFSPQAVKDREFQKMKLAEYNRLWYAYNGKATTTDEKALLTMLGFQRRKMEKSLYPGILTRLVRRGIAYLKAVIVQRNEANLTKQQQVQQYTFNTIPAKESGHPREQQSQGAAMHTRQGQRYGQDLGRRLRQQNDKSKGHSL